MQIILTTWLYSYIHLLLLFAMHFLFTTFIFPIKLWKIYPASYIDKSADVHVPIVIIVTYCMKDAARKGLKGPVHIWANVCLQKIFVEILTEFSHEVIKK